MRWSGLLWIGAALAILVVLHRLALWAEKKGWIYYRQNGGGGVSGAMSNALAEFDAVLNPASEHRLEEERSQRIIASDTSIGRMSIDHEGEILFEDSDRDRKGTGEGETEAP